MRVKEVMGNVFAASTSIRCFFSSFLENISMGTKACIYWAKLGTNFKNGSFHNVDCIITLSWFAHIETVETIQYNNVDNNNFLINIDSWNLLCERFDHQETTESKSTVSDNQNFVCHDFPSFFPVFTFA